MPGKTSWWFVLVLAVGCKPEERPNPPLPASGRVVQLAGGGTFTCALFEGGATRCWGTRFDGQIAQRPPTTIDVGGNVIQLGAGMSHVCGVLDSGAVRCWGYNDWGALGYGTTDAIAAPPGDVDVGARVVQVGAGHASTCGVVEGGALRCWGAGQGGRLGYGSRDNVGHEGPPSAAGNVDVGGKVVQVDGGISLTCALLDGGTVRCWGQNVQGEAGYPQAHAIGDDETPASVGDIDIGGKVSQIAAGGGHTCAVLEGGSVRCWGIGTGGQLGYGNTKSIGDDETPASAGDVDVGGRVVQIATGLNRTCALLEAGKVRCWGRNRDDKAGGAHLGYERKDNIGDDETPASAGDVPLI